MKTNFSRFAIAAAIMCAFAGTLHARTRSSSSSSMSGGEIVLVLLGIGLLIGIIVALAAFFDRRRAQAIQAVATRLGLTYRWKPTDADKALIIGAGIAKLGHAHVTSHVLEASQTQELRMTLFDHAYTVGSGKSSQTYTQTVTRMQSPLLNVPTFTLFPETFLSKIGKFFGGADINFPEAPEFSRKYILRGPDEAAVRSFFTAALLQFLGRPELRPLTIDASGDTLFVHRSNARAKPEQLEAYIAEGKQVLAAVFEAQRSTGAVASPPPMPPPLPV